MARITSRDNQRLSFVSHGFCLCARSSLRCSGTRRLRLPPGEGPAPLLAPPALHQTPGPPAPATEPETRGHVVRRPHQRPHPTRPARVDRVRPDGQSLTLPNAALTRTRYVGTESQAVRLAPGRPVRMTSPAGCMLPVIAALATIFPPCRGKIPVPELIGHWQPVGAPCAGPPPGPAALVSVTLAVRCCQWISRLFCALAQALPCQCVADFGLGSEAVADGRVLTGRLLGRLGA